MRVVSDSSNYAWHRHIERALEIMAGKLWEGLVEYSLAQFCALNDVSALRSPMIN